MSSKTPSPALKLSQSYLNYTGEELFREFTIGDVIDQAADLWPDAEAIVDLPRGIRRTFSQAQSEAEQLAAGLLSLGLQRHDRIGILSPNCYEWYVSFFAAAKAGLILVALNYSSEATELAVMMNKVEMKALICVEKYRALCMYDLLASIAPEIRSSQPGMIRSRHVVALSTVIMLGNGQNPGTYSWNDILRHKRDTTKVKEMQSSMKPQDPFNIHFTSGSTGSPKAAVLSHHAMVNNAFFGGRRRGYQPYLDRFCFTLPMCHNYGCIALLSCAPQFGVTCVIPGPTFNATDAIAAVDKERCTVIFGSPTMYIDMLRVISEDKPYDISSLKTAAVGSAPCSEELVIRIQEKMGISSVHNGYGLTEANAVFLAFDRDSLQKRSTTVGFPLDYTEVKVVDEACNIVPIGTAGELCVRSYANMTGYWNDEGRTKEVIDESQWVHTGDLCILHEDGYASIAGRLKDIIIRGGENISPIEIEKVLCTHPDVIDAQVIGIPDCRLGESVCACMKLEDGSNVNEDQLREFCKKRLSYFKIPERFLFMQEFPKTSAGKVNKRRLKENVTAIIVQ